YVVVGALVLNWAMISLTHLKFKAMVKEKNLKTSFPALWSPLGNYLVLAFIGVVLYIMWQQGFKESVLMIPIWITAMLLFYDYLNPKSIESIKESRD
ncbi:MAG: amino acid permease, partial [Acinetobacter sp.]